MAQSEDGDVFYSDFDRASSYELRSADADTEDGRRRRQLIAESLDRYRKLAPYQIAGFVWPEQHRDYRAGDRNQLMVAVYALEHQQQRYLPHAVELDEAHASSAGMALSDAVHALLVADRINDGDFKYLTDPLSRLLGLDLAQHHHRLRSANATDPRPLVPHDAPVVDPLPDHRLWAHSRTQLEHRLADIYARDGVDVYVVDLHLDVGWFDLDIREAGIQVRWDTRSRLAERQKTWNPHPDLLKLDPHAADELPWEWPAFLGADPADTLWKRDSDPTGHALLTDYAQQLGLWYTDAELESDEDELLDRQCELDEYLQAGLPAPVRAMHEDGTIERVFGEPIPITFSAQDSHVAAWELGRAANPPDLYALFGPIQERYWSPG